MADRSDNVEAGIFGIVLPNAILAGSAGMTAGLVRLSIQLGDAVDRHGVRLMAAVAAAPVELVHEEVRIHLHHTGARLVCHELLHSTAYQALMTIHLQLSSCALWARRAAAVGVYTLLVFVR